jgi:hypothetical protein
LAPDRDSPGGLRRYSQRQPLDVKAGPQCDTAVLAPSSPIGGALVAVSQLNRDGTAATALHRQSQKVRCSQRWESR